MIANLEICKNCKRLLIFSLDGENNYFCMSKETDKKTKSELEELLYSTYESSYNFFIEHLLKNKGVPEDCIFLYEQIIKNKDEEL